MKLINNHRDLISIFSTEKWTAPTKFHSLNYKNAPFDCGCESSSHLADNPTNKIFANASKKIFSVRFIIRCKNDFFSLVNFEGIIITKATSEWSVSKNILNEALKELLLPNIE